MTDDDLLDRLADLWHERDPVPRQLVDRLTRHARAEADLLATDWDYELLTLVERSTGLAGVRSADTTLTLQFAADHVDLLLRVGGDPRSGTAQIDGWVVPALPARVRLVRSADQRDLATAEAGSSGRFDLTVDLGAAGGGVRLHLEPLEDDRPTFVTPTFDLEDDAA